MRLNVSLTFSMCRAFSSALLYIARLGLLSNPFHFSRTYEDHAWGFVQNHTKLFLSLSDANDETSYELTVYQQ